MANQVSEQVKQKASEIVEQVKGQAVSGANEHRRTLASGFQAVGQAFRHLGHDLSGREEGPIADYAAQLGHTLAGHAERAAGYFEGRDVREIVTDIQKLGRRSPGLFVGGAFLIGFAASRFLKSSRPIPDINASMPDPSRALPAPESAPHVPGQVWQRGTGAGGF